MTENIEVNEPEVKKTSTRKESPKTKAEAVESEPTQVVSQETNAEEEVKEQEETVMYIGPSLQKIGLQQNALFRNGIPKTIQQHIEKCSAIGALMVPISRLSEARSNLIVKGTAENMLNQQVLSYGRGEM